MMSILYKASPDEVKMVLGIRSGWISIFYENIPT